MFSHYPPYISLAFSFCSIAPKINLQIFPFVASNDTILRNLSLSLSLSNTEGEDNKNNGDGTMVYSFLIFCEETSRVHYPFLLIIYLVTKSYCIHLCFELFRLLDVWFRLKSIIVALGGCQVKGLPDLFLVCSTKLMRKGSG